MLSGSSLKWVGKELRVLIHSISWNAFRASKSLINNQGGKGLNPQYIVECFQGKKEVKDD